MHGRGCTHGHLQQVNIAKEESRSPPVSLYALMESCVMGAIAEKKLITVDKPGAFLQGDWPYDKYTGYIIFEGIMVDIIYEINLLFRSMVFWNKDGKMKFIFGQLIKAVLNQV